MIHVVHKHQRIGVFVDVQNMYYSARNLYKKKVDFKSLLKDVIADRKLIRAIAYVIKADVKDESQFYDALERMGFEVKAKDIQVFYDGSLFL
ncbi:MAG: NYN domain-containing protein, partial [Candidatus Thermoplasmatota archaeon]|nr:NYN domain-containing protein [Candidatus Thermoplasmatota archaeon]